jgi:hypothetical protein
MKHKRVDDIVGGLQKTESLNGTRPSYIYHGPVFSADSGNIVSFDHNIKQFYMMILTTVAMFV